jgi:heavy metal translocating P-type ATPase
MRARNTITAGLSVAAIGAHLLARYAFSISLTSANVPLWIALVAGGAPLVLTLLRQTFAGRFGADLLAGCAIVTSVTLGQYLVAVVIVLMWSGGQSLEEYATHRASSVLDSLARRSPSVAHRREGEGYRDIPLADIRIGDALIVLPHETCPVDGIVTSGASTMDESYLSGEPYLMRKTAGSAVMSGAINGDNVLDVVAEHRPEDSRYARIMAVVRKAEQDRPPMRRLSDRLGAWYTPVALAVAGVGWWSSGDPHRFLAVLVIATPCPLLLAIPVAILGAISLAAKRSILVRDASLLEQINVCQTVIFDKTGTLTLGRPTLTGVVPCAGFDSDEVLAMAASLEQYSRHPLAPAVIDAADRAQVTRHAVAEMSERAGQGLTGRVGDRRVEITSRRRISAEQANRLASESGGLECIVVIDGVAAGVCQFRDMPRHDSGTFIAHLGPKHRVDRLLLVSGDRESEVRYLAKAVGISNVYFGQSPEQKVEIVRREVLIQPTLFVGDGLNDAPAMLAATAGVALGKQSDVAAESAGAVILDGSLLKVDELMHIASRLRRIALQSAVSGMGLSVIGMGLAVAGWLPPLSGAIAQEVIDIAAVLNALRAALAPKELSDI